MFIEALFAGLPIVYPKGAAIDGYFDGMPFAIGVNARCDAEISNAMSKLIAEEEELKSALREWQKSDHARKFSRLQIADQFSRGLNLALAASPPAGHSGSEA